MRQVVHGDATAERHVSGEGVELDAREGLEGESRGARPARQLRRADQPLILVRPARDQTEEVFSADVGRRKGLGVAVTGRDKQGAAGPQRSPSRRLLAAGAGKW